MSVVVIFQNLTKHILVNLLYLVQPEAIASINLILLLHINLKFWSELELKSNLKLLSWLWVGLNEKRQKIKFFMFVVFYFPTFITYEKNFL